MSNPQSPSSSDDGGGRSSDNEHPRRQRRWHRHRKYLYMLSRVILWGLALTAIYLCLNAIGNVLFPVLISLVIAYLFDPLIDWFEARGVSRTLGIVTVLLGGLGVLVGFSLFLYPTIVDQVRQVGDKIPRVVTLVQEQTLPWVEKTFDYELPKTVPEGVEKYGQSLTDAMPTILNQVKAWSFEIVTSTGVIVATVFNLLLIPIFSFYFLRDFDHIRLKIAEFIPPHHRDVVLDRLRKMDDVVGEWVRGQLQVASMMAVMYAVGLGGAFYGAGIDLQAGIAIGFLTGMLNFIPYFGVAVGFVLATLMVVINWSGFAGVVGVVAVFGVVQVIEGYILTPKIVGDKVGLNPVTVMIVLLLGGEVYGLIGVLLAIPVFGALKVLFPDIVAYYRDTAFFTGRDPVTGHTSADGDDVPDDVVSSEADAGKNGALDAHDGDDSPGRETLETESDGTIEEADGDSESDEGGEPDGAIEEVDDKEDSSRE